MKLTRHLSVLGCLVLASAPGSAEKIPNSITVSPDGKRVAVALIGENRVRLWDMQTGEELFRGE